MSVKLGIISLGCDKNRVDTENLLAYAGDAGIEFTADENEADVILINTCAFIKKASRKPSTPFWNLSKRKGTRFQNHRYGLSARKVQAGNRRRNPGSGRIPWYQRIQQNRRRHQIG